MYGVFPSYKTIKQLLQDSEKGDVEAKAQLNVLCKSIETCEQQEKGQLSTWAEVIGKINEHTEKSFVGKEECIGDISPVYVMLLSTYRAESWLLWKKKDKDIQSNEILRYLDSIVAHMALHLTLEQGAEWVLEPLPGGWLMICRWFEPLLDHFRTFGGRMHVMDDCSMVMLLNISKDNHITPPEADIAVVKIIWTYRQSFIMRLNNTMLKHARQSPGQPHDKDVFNVAVTNMHETEKLICQALLNLVSKRKQKNVVNLNNLASETNTLTRTMGLHVTTWNWPSPSIKNQV
ncbi:uncharacterized protein F5147DRAFT_646967 [Suillus discolor]|uniref:Uncharacterized protein n=1 Tax=Suillus discolor TaxID=1912936 RepID=A0A9P7FKY7_9AGAM|nr:uncharacterized protein F5147DRAFT_646967 [Suillus discolor]KAG2120462.1 hypothetical protein F5147DRAFT_646967 [Suillus discolor]